MRIAVSPQAREQILKLPKTEQKKVSRRIYQLSTGSIHGKKLKGNLAGKRVVRAWPYRIIYRQQDNNLEIVAIIHRQRAY